MAIAEGLLIHCSRIMNLLQISRGSKKRRRESLSESYKQEAVFRSDFLQTSYVTVARVRRWLKLLPL